MRRTSFLLQNLKRESNCVNTGDTVMVLAFCNFPHSPLSVYQISLNYLRYFKRYTPDKSVTDGGTEGRTDKAAIICSPFREHKNILIWKDQRDLFARKSKEIASEIKMCSLMHYKVRPSNYLFQIFLKLKGRPEENSSYFSNQIFSHVQLDIHWTHL